MHNTVNHLILFIIYHRGKDFVEWDVSYRWSLSLYCLIRNSDQMTVGKTQPTLQTDISSTESLGCSFIIKVIKQANFMILPKHDRLNIFINVHFSLHGKILHTSIFPIIPYESYDMISAI